MIALALLLQAAPVPGTLTTYADWIVGCDNALACQANALASDGPSPAALMLVVRREAGGASPARLELPIPEGQKRGARLSLAVDGKTVATIVAPGGEGRLALPLAGDLLAALLAGRDAALLDTGGNTIARASLAGISAALLAIDEVQSRTGTVTALLRPGRKPARSVPIAPPLPVVIQPPAGTRPARTLSPKDAARLIGKDNAVCDYATGPVAPRAFRLDAAHSLVTVDHPCGNGAYNVYTSAFVLDEKGRASPAPLDAPAGMTGAIDNQLVTGGWDLRTRRLTSYARGRGLGDCGTEQSFAWDGTRFRLVEQKAMGECRGSTDYITTWRARVEAR